MKKASFLWAFIFALLFAGVFNGCINFDDVAYDNSEQDYIKVQIFTARAFDSTAVRVKADTIRPGDSLVFLADVYPSRAMRNQTSYWNMDGMYFSSEYYFKSTLLYSGRHLLEFYLVDFFGDTLVDSLTVVVANPPILDISSFIPANGSQNFMSTEFISFAWNVSDPDELWNLKHHFTLREKSASQKPLVDTILSQPNFTYYGALKALTQYDWFVFVENEVKMVSKDTIRSSLFTQGSQGENAVQGLIKLSAPNINTKATITIKDSSDKVVFKKTEDIINSNCFFSLKPLLADNYSLTVSINDYSDYKDTSVNINLRNNQVNDLGTIQLEDLIKPTIKSITGSDTLDYADTLKIFVQDNGGEIPQNRYKAQLENTLIIAAKLKNDTLFVPIKELENSWSHRILTITVFDQSENKTTKSFIITPNTTLPEVFDE